MAEWTRDQVEERLIEAADVLKRLPAPRVPGFFTTWPETMVEFADMVGREREPMRRPPPDPAAISRMEETIRWSRWEFLEPEVDAKLLWARAEWLENAVEGDLLALRHRARNGAPALGIAALRPGAIVGRLEPPQFAGAAGIVDDRLNLAAMTHDPCIRQQPRYVGLTEPRHLSEFEPGESRPEVLALGEDSAPAQARLEALKAQFLEQPYVVHDGETPFAVMIVEKFGRGCAPTAARAAVRPGHSRAHAGAFTKSRAGTVRLGSIS
jgi:hypothetical protein